MSMLLTAGAAPTVAGGRISVSGNLAVPPRLGLPTAVSSLRPPRLPLLTRGGTVGDRSRDSVAPLAAAASSSSSSVVDQGESESRKTRYHFLVASAKFMLDEEEHFKELLFERLRNYGERNKTQDFWLVVEPKFLEGFPDITRRLRRPAAALVSTDATWLTFMKLRLDRVLCDSYEADSVEEALASNPTQVEFDKPEVWTAPYPKYEYGWWEPFLPPAIGHKEPVT
ncbi:hypothetical protein MLD38_009374 [Melastoma candidum]|uniref:Uncharacterized protein n=1 Tax=Melastoma candidum TaxID=119954 RepID=A0ACB9RX05_9MYRT|nr:hypothetical protein MLD38_009374 [Melastoma candidum]